MALSAFDDRSREPRQEELFEVLGPAAGSWARLLSGVGSRFDPLAQDWVFSGKQWGWALRLKHKKRAVLYMTPGEGFFYVGFALGQKAVDAARASDLPASVLKLIASSQKYAEGRAVRLEVRSEEDVENALVLADLKMSS